MNIADLAHLGPEGITEALSHLTPQELAGLQYEWKFWARPGQLAPTHFPWTFWLLLAGRGYGKTRVGAEWIRDMAANGRPGGGRIALIAATNRDIRETMLEGESGLLNICPPWFAPKYEPSKSRVVFPNGVICSLFSSEEPDRLRGPQCGAFWADEVAAWNHMGETWSNLMFGFRLGKNPQGVLTTTPRPVKLVRELLAKERSAKNPSGSVVVTRGSTYENRANLAEPFFDEIITAYEGTRLGRQEIDGEVLEDNPNSLFQQSWFDRSRLDYAPRDLQNIATAVDPQVKENIDSDEAGIVTGGKKLVDGVMHYYIIADDSLKPVTTDDWGRQAVKSYFAHQADVVVAEINNGGTLVVKNITAVNPNVPVVEVTATRGKTIRAEPIATLFEQGRIHFCGKFPKLETQCIEWDPTLPKGQQKSPDRMDAMVWCIAHLSGMKGQAMVQGRARG